jgi:ureidoacrylate peracid hydrolase
MTNETLNLTGRYYRYYPWDAPLGEAEDALTIPLDETVFLLVDVYGQAHGEGFESPADTPEFYRPSADDPVGRIIREKIVPAKAAARRAGLQVVYVTNYLSPGLSEGNEWRNMSIRTCGVDVLTEWIPPTPILEHAEVIAPQPGEPVVRKQMYSGFFETNLDSVLRGYGAKYLVAVGFDSRICFGTTVTDAMYRDYRVIALRDAICTTEFPETEAGGWANFLAIRFIEANVGYTSTVDDFIRACDEIVAARAQPAATRSVPAATLAR